MGQRIQFNEFGAAFIQSVLTPQRVQQNLDQMVDQVLRTMTFPPQMEGHDVRIDVRKGALQVRARGVGQFSVALQLKIQFVIKIGPLVETYQVQADVGFALEVQTWTPLLLAIAGPPVDPASVRVTVLGHLGTQFAWGQAEPKFKTKIAEGLNGAVTQGTRIDVLAALAKLAPVDRPRPRARVDYATFGTEFLRHAINPVRLQNEFANAARTGVVGTDRVGPANIAYRVGFRGVQVMAGQHGHFEVTLQLGVRIEIVIAKVYKDEFDITAVVRTGVQVSVGTPCMIGVGFDPVTANSITLSKANIRGPGLTWGQVEPALKTQIVNAMASALAYRQFDVTKMVDQAMKNGPRENALKKTAVKKTAVKKTAVKKTAVKKTAAKKTVAKKAAPKPAPKKPAPKKTVARSKKSR